MPSILVVDDEPNNFDVIDAFLSDNEYQLHYASGGQEALKSLDIFQPDVILLDVMMPGIDGMEVCRQIKAMPEWQGVPIIMVTALTAKEDLARCLKVGADDFISKPVNSVELRARVSSMLRIKMQYENIKSLSQLQANTIDLLQNSLNELRRNMVYSLPHELNTPLNGISGIIGILIDQYDSMTAEEIHEFLGLAQQSSFRLEKLIQRFLTYLQLEMSASKINSPTSIGRDRNEIAVQSVIEKIAKLQATSFGRDPDLVLKLEDGNVLVGAKDFQRIIEELLENAFKFSQKGTPVTVTCKPIHHRLHLWISDLGRGMTEEQIAKIGAFMQFERKYYEQQGVGLGLKIVKKIVEVYGGEFSISSIYHQETTVHITLPMVS
ncbi:hybrid sensor histidine kinase/response regulator [Tumidithrix elongata RA019]|uniref:histidine kinase n=1 Tax=Tumidithrix elongata BACA0141 TaxID=2716417 RepID=A0AAW9PR40_9CYAN|nr:hybrid sensor histidine kinase/response regulator [Tumidithrix elongata RA019]